MPQVGFAISRTAGTNGSAMLKLNVYLSGVCSAGRSIAGSVLPAILCGKRLSGAVSEVPRRTKLSLQASESMSSPSNSPPAGAFLTPSRSVKMKSVTSGISSAVARLLKITTSAVGAQP